MTRPIHIAYIVQQFAPEIGAGPARVLEMAHRWQSQGARVTVVTAFPNRPEGRIHPDYRGRLFVEEQFAGVRVLRSWLFATRKYGFARTLLNNVSFAATSTAHALARLGHVDVVIASSPPFFVHFAGEGLRLLRRIALVLEVRDLWPDYLVGMGVVRNRVVASALFAAERRLFRKAARVVVVTESFRQRVIAKGVAADRVDVVSNGVDVEQYARSIESPPLPELCHRNGEVLVGYLGNFGAGQGLSCVLEAAALLEREGRAVRFVIAGEGSAREELLELHGHLGLESVSIAPPIPKHATRAFYNACDICLVPLASYPILQETVPSKLFEILACEVPVVGAMGGEGARILERSGGGVAVPPGNPEALAAAILDLAQRPPQHWRQLGAAGRVHVMKHFSRDILADRYLGLLDAVAAEGRAARA